MFLVPNIDQMYKEMKKIVEVRNKHGNGDEFPDFADLFFCLYKNMLGSAVDRKHTYFFFWPHLKIKKVNFFLSCNCVILSTNKGGKINVSVIMSWT